MPENIRALWLVIGLCICQLITFSAKGQITGIKIAGDTCNSLTLSLQVVGTSSAPSFFWRFGDTASGSNDTITITGTSTSAFPTHTFSRRGVYTVCVSFQEPGGAVTTVCRTISIGLCCTGSILSADSCFNSNVAFSVVTSATVTSILWNFGDPLSGTANFSTSSAPSHLFSAPGLYTVTAFITATCDTFTLTFPITIINCDTTCTGVIQLRDSCAGNQTNFSLVTPNTVSSYLWVFGDPPSGRADTSNLSAPNHVFTSAGVYTVTLTAIALCGVITRTYIANIVTCTQPCETSIQFTDSCAGNSAIFSIAADSTVNSIDWNFGDPSSGLFNSSRQLVANHRFERAGSYVVSASVNLSCGLLNVTKDIAIINCTEQLKGCSVILPGAFTPNGDGKNDICYPRSEDLLNVKVFRLYNRWGQLLFERQNTDPNDETAGWDGKFQGQFCAPDTYMYYLEGTCISGKNILVKGDVMIIR